MRNIILASGSPRRRDLLTTAGISFEVRTSDADERTELTDPAEVVQELSCRKCLDVLRQMKEDPHISRIPVIVMTADRDAEVESLDEDCIAILSDYKVDLAFLVLTQEDQCSDSL